MDQLHNQPFHQLVASYAGKLLRDHFGKGPESAVVSIGHTFITIYLRNFLTPSERILLDQQEEEIILRTRDKLMQAVIPEIRSYLEIINGVIPEEVYYDWDLQRGTGMITVISPEPGKHGPPVEHDYNGKAGIEAEILRITRQIHKDPVEISSYELNPRTLLIVRSGVLLELEKELVRVGQGDFLKNVKKKLEKEQMMNSKTLESILPCTITDCFADWNYTLDKSILLLMINPSR